MSTPCAFAETLPQADSGAHEVRAEEFGADPVPHLRGDERHGRGGLVSESFVLHQSFVWNVETGDRTSANSSRYPLQ